MQPIQDLNGYSNPWAGGAGKNKLKNNAASTVLNDLTFTVNTDGSVGVTGKATANTTVQINMNCTLNAGSYILSGCPAGGADGHYRLRLGDSTDSYLGNDQGSGVTFTLGSDSFVTVKLVVENTTDTLNLTFKPMICLSSDAEPTTFAPYENICPIYGHTGATVPRTGKNFLQNTQTTQTLRGVDFTVNADGIVSVAGGQTVTGGNAFFDVGTINNSGGDSFIANGCPAGGNASTTYGVQILLNGVFLTADNGAGTTAFSNIGTLTYRIVLRNGYTTPAGGLTFYPMIRVSSDTDATFKPYNGDTYSVSWQDEAGTVYGGSINFTAGVLTAAKAKWAYNGQNNPTSITAIGSLTRFWLGTLPGKKFVDGGALCDSFQSLMNAAYDAETVGIGNGYSSYPTSVWVKAPTNIVGSTATSIKAYFSANPIEIVYDLETPITYQLTPTEIGMLRGQNYLWATSTTDQP